MLDQSPKTEPVSRSLWQAIVTWLTAPPLSVRVLQDELARAHEENRRLSDLLTQAWEQGRVIPQQASHQLPPAAPVEQRQGYGEIQGEYARQVEADYARYLLDEEKRRLNIQAIIGGDSNGTAHTGSN